MDVMTRQHPRWDEFCEKLGEFVSYGTREDGKGVILGCTGKIDRPHAHRILDEMGMDVESSLDYFKDHGGFCDCEILLNVMADEENPLSRLLKGIP